MSTRPDTWMPLYIGDYLRDTSDLSTLQHGAYLLLIMQAWIRDGLLPDNDERLRAITRMDERDWKRSRELLMSLFIKDEGGYRHKRVDSELARAKATNAQRKAAGTASAEARALQRKSNARSTPVDITLERNSRPSQVHKKEESKSRAHAPATPRTFGGIEDGITYNEAGQELWSGWIAEEVKDKVMEAARLDDARWTGDFLPVIHWLKAGIDFPSVLAGIKRVADRADYQPKQSLAYFTEPIKTEFNKLPARERHENIMLAQRYRSH